MTKTSPAACWRAAFVAALLGFALTCAAQQRGEASESTVKAAFLYKFAGYIEWPVGLFAATDAPFVIAVTPAAT